MTPSCIATCELPARDDTVGLTNAIGDSCDAIEVGHKK